MKADEFRHQLNTEYGTDKPFPKTLEVDIETYVACFQDIIEHKYKQGDFFRLGNSADGLYNSYHIACGTKHQGLMFKGVELILKEKE